ncbi:protein kinase [Achlya hypogyna]|uniref:Protein kinase n=1 Tax=Achlya hypogyna TaxID=1202772 RepID=A0A1V9YFK6_ACHHY|nr:protein kinase [Achlya hypogyna]
MAKTPLLLLAGLALAAGQTTPAPASACTLDVAEGKWCLKCPNDKAPALCTPVAATATINVVLGSSAVNASLPSTLDIADKVLRSLIVKDSSKTIKTLNIVRAFDSTFAMTNFSSGMFSGVESLDTLNVNCIESNLKNVYLEVTRVEDGALPMALRTLNMDGCFTNYLRLPENNNLTELAVHRHEMSELPRIGIMGLISAAFTNSAKLTKFPSQYLDVSSLMLLNLSYNSIVEVNFDTEQQADKYKKLGVSMVTTGAFVSGNLTCNKLADAVCNPVSASNSGSSGPSSGAVTTLVVVSCLASILVLVAIIVHRRSRRSSSRSPGMSSAHSPDDFFYDVDEAYVTNQTMSKYKTAGANDATLTKLAPEHIALARCLGGDIWMGEMTTTNSRIVLRRAPRLAGDHITDSFFQGVKEMARLSHPNLVTYLGVTCLSGTDIYAVAEFQEKGSLASVYQTVPLTWDVQLRMAIDVAEAIHYLHTLLPSPVPCEHLKSSMVLVGANYNCKLNIFHFMASFKASILCKEMYGANRIAWKAPEVLINEWKNFLAADVYSLGVVLAEIGTTTRPFDKEIAEVGMVQTDVWILDNVMAGRGVPPPFDTKSPKWFNLPDAYQKLVFACLDPVPSRRPNSGIVLQRLKELKTSIHTAEL